ncbi:uncharacterized protein EMH_0051370 [Eimeria mitis]|uniref:Uncharacterized protein n=1 Tax=Eimeria mitis TaxID=44415 RepID=U6JW41_9EIME|nr:uncharacterized protein EMH_0051370 [Eimeria mitis]CDJ29629.1 hypothetical protein EMH_0051370 [Eimeria mitis]
MASSLRTPDHNARLIYDDFNELFWSRQCLDILHRFTKETEASAQEIAQTVQVIHPSADTEPFSDHQLASKPIQKPQPKNCPMGLSVSRESLNAVVAELSSASKPGSGIKTFVEHRSYAQVLRNFWRVFAWHVTTFAGIFLLYAVLDEESSYSAQKQWAITTLTAAISYGMLPIFDLMLVDYRTLGKPQWWQLAWRRVPIHSARIGFALAALVTVALDGLDSAHLQWTGLLSILYWAFFVCHGAHYFLYMRIQDRMPFFVLLWSNKWLAPLSKPSTYTGSVPLLAENFTHVLKYSFFWLFAMAAKALYWLYFVLPPMVSASKHVGYVSCRPVYINSVVFWPGYIPAVLQAFIWVPAFLIWLFDMQIFFLLFGAFYGSIDGYIRRVGYITNCRKIQQRLLPMLPLTAVFRLPGEKATEDKGLFERMPSGITQLHGALQLRRASNVDRYCRRGTLSRMPTNARDQQQWCVQPPAFALSSSPNDFRSLSVQYANTTDPYVSMVPQMMAKTVTRASFLAPSEAESVAKANAQLKKALLAMIMLPSTEPEELGGSNIPLPVQEYVKAVSVCFGSDSMVKDIPSILPAPLQRAEVAVMIEQLEIILHHTSLLLLASEEERNSVNVGDLPLLPEELAEMRALHAQLGEADANVVLADNGSKYGGPSDREQAESRRIAAVEHGLRMFFRRAARILKADDPSFKCAETQRR